jgi:hypothetical protein
MQSDEVVVFLGPTLALIEARQFLDADYRGPAKRGDVYRASKSDPHTIVLIDGAFEADAAVMHNEILWALAKGINVWGAASIGALRAAELAPFGMMGFGEIYENYRQGVVERDDAVAVVHAPEELGHAPLSMPLVDVWATLDRALEQGILSSDEHDFLKDVARGVFYKRLSFEVLLEIAVQVGFHRRRAEVLHQHVISNGAFSQKRADAIGALRAVSNAASSRSLEGSFFFENTSAWEQLKIELDSEDVAPADPALTGELELAAIGLALAEREIQRRGFVLGRAEFEEAARSFRRSNNLQKSSDVLRWLEIARFEHYDYVKLVEDEFLVEHSRRSLKHRLKELYSRMHRRRRSSNALKHRDSLD